MIISKVKKESNVYYNLHAEQVVHASLVDDARTGIYDDVLTISTIERIVEDFGRDKDLNIILDFSNFVSCQNNIDDEIAKLKKASKSLLFINVIENVIKGIGAFNIYCNPNNVLVGTKYNKFYVSDRDDFEIVEFTNLQEEKFIECLKKFTIDTGVNAKIHHSSSVYLSKYIDIKEMISRENTLFIYSLYNLSLKIKKHWIPNIGDVINLVNKYDRPTLICQNLNGSYIGSVLAKLLDLDLLVLDKLGPINKLYSTLDNKIEQNKNYILVSDVVCLGSEMKIAKNLIIFLGGNYLGNISIIRIQTIFEKDKPNKNVECVLEITNKNNSNFGYKIKTVLDFSSNVDSFNKDLI